jgi:hypothetical protein
MGYWLEPLKPDLRDLPAPIDDLEEEGLHFQCTGWKWVSIWEIICQCTEGTLTPEQVTKGRYNDGVEIDGWQVDQIVAAIEAGLANGTIKDYITSYRDEMRAKFPNKVCDTCNGTGTGGLLAPLGDCLACQGKGERSPYGALICETDLLEFVEFARRSGGFKIN